VIRLEDLDFDLPEAAIARHPTENREDSRLLVLEGAVGSPTHHGFQELPNLLREGDLLVLNDTRVLPARLVGAKATSGMVEALYLSSEEDGLAELMVSGNRLRPGVEVFLKPSLGYRLQEKRASGRWAAEVIGAASWGELLSLAGLPPLPPYIRRQRCAHGEQETVATDVDRYQTLWASVDGAVAAPTASLHFSAGVLDELDRAGVQTASLTLHVGEGTFLPVEEENIAEHPIHEEWFEVPAGTQEKIRETKEKGGRVIAAGTTVCRALEGWTATGTPSGRTSLFILPGHEFLVLDGLLTNFHTPRSTLLCLVSAFAEFMGVEDGLGLVKSTYALALSEGYRFYSYGDASLWLKKPASTSG